MYGAACRGYVVLQVNINRSLAMYQMGLALSKSINVSHKAIYTAHYKVDISVMKKYIEQLFRCIFFSVTEIRQYVLTANVKKKN